MCSQTLPFRNWFDENMLVSKTSGHLLFFVSLWVDLSSLLPVWRWLRWEKFPHIYAQDAPTTSGSRYTTWIDGLGSMLVQSLTTVLNNHLPINRFIELGNVIVLFPSSYCIGKRWQAVGWPGWPKLDLSARDRYDSVFPVAVFVYRISSTFLWTILSRSVLLSWGNVGYGHDDFDNEAQPYLASVATCKL